ncbi:apoptosis regulator Bcl-2-like isoform X2 [Brienomyrus brachyistius]|uniref:apoptosis regulator Bcl-2-like isoform X2 n=1 Tax=Brienomyrus brachyistius TaxID=42636 RepID=UPI0020B3F6C5|nr:apoptosis regulator Bcl-2-like isoform X2 [Brienomyrus brachyistius]
MANQSTFDSKIIVENYIHQKLSNRGIDWGMDFGEETEPPANGSTGTALSRRLQTGAAAAAHIRNRSPQLDPHAALHAVLREAGDQVERRYRRDLVEMSARLHLTPDTAESKFAAVIEELFRDGTNWGRIVAFFEFGVAVCVESVNREMTSQVDHVASWMTEYLNGPLHTWIQENGGWN